MIASLSHVIIELDEIAAELEIITSELTLVECDTVIKTPAWGKIKKLVERVDTTKVGPCA